MLYHGAVRCAPYVARLRREVEKNTHSFSQLLPEFSTDLFFFILDAVDEKVVALRQRRRFLQVSNAH